MHTATHIGIADLIINGMNLDASSGDALRDGSADPDRPLAQRRYRDLRFRGKHHGGADNAGYVSWWLQQARLHWLRRERALAAYHCGVGLHYLVDAFVPNGRNPNHARIEARCDNAFSNINVRMLSRVNAPPHECLGQVQRRVAGLPLVATSGTDLLAEAVQWALFAAGSVFASEQPPIDSSALTRQARTVLVGIDSELANNPLAASYAVLDREVRTKKSERQKLLQTASDQAEMLARRIRVPLTILGIAISWATAVLIVALIEFVLPQGLGVFGQVAFMVVLGSIGIWLCLDEHFGPLPVCIFRTIIAGVLCVGVRWNTRDWIRPHARHRDNIGRELARLLRDYQRYRSAVVAHFRYEWHQAQHVFGSWYVFLAVPQLPEDKNLELKLRNLYQDIALIARLLSYVA